MMKRQQHAKNLIWLLLLLWLSIAMSNDAVSLAERINMPGNAEHQPLSICYYISADNDDITLPVEQKEPFQAVPVFDELICSAVPIHDTGYYRIAVAVFSCYVSTHLQKYRRRKTRTPSLSPLCIS